MQYLFFFVKRNILKLNVQAVKQTECGAEQQLQMFRRTAVDTCCDVVAVQFSYIHLMKYGVI